MKQKIETTNTSFCPEINSEVLVYGKYGCRTCIFLGKYGGVIYVTKKRNLMDVAVENGVKILKGESIT